jgi:hypothetical protein
MIAVFVSSVMDTGASHSVPHACRRGKPGEVSREHSNVGETHRPSAVERGAPSRSACQRVPWRSEVPGPLMLRGVHSSTKMMAGNAHAWTRDPHIADHLGDRKFKWHFCASASRAFPLESPSATRWRTRPTHGSSCAPRAAQKPRRSAPEQGGARRRAVRTGCAGEERAAGVPWGEGRGKGGFWKAGGERFQRLLPSSMRMRFHREILVPRHPTITTSIISLFLYPSSCYTHVPEIPSRVSLPHVETSKEFSATEEKSPRWKRVVP